MKYFYIVFQYKIKIIEKTSINLLTSILLYGIINTVVRR